jgi:hypothetical protein
MMAYAQRRRQMISSKHYPNLLTAGVSRILGYEWSASLQQFNITPYLDLGASHHIAPVPQRVYIPFTPARSSNANQPLERYTNKIHQSSLGMPPVDLLSFLPLLQPSFPSHTWTSPIHWNHSAQSYQDVLQVPNLICRGWIL